VTIRRLRDKCGFVDSNPSYAAAHELALVKHENIVLHRVIEQFAKTLLLAEACRVAGA
jgi:hypothetical protein